MNPREFQKLAVRLSATAGSAERRTAISRSYYAAFNVAASHLRAMKFPIAKGAAAHGEVRHCLANSGNIDVIQTANSLREMHAHRIRADYELERQDIESAAT